ncbi:MAG: bifunctional hydroxymethylpyrimidine kinase/phosphomethylpyrimidine kinase [Polyangiales bacterium]
MTRVCALTVAGTDPTSGAGVQGDLRAFMACGVHPLSVVACITAQGTRGVRAVFATPKKQVRAQLDALFADVTPRAMKTGALASVGAVSEVLRVLDQRPRLKCVVDPVIASTSGAPLIDRRGLALMRTRLVPRATLVTPNAIELALLIDEPPDSLLEEADMIAGARRLIAAGARAVLAKGGHLRGPPVDLLVTKSDVHRWQHARLRTQCTHGTGCTLSAAVTAHLALGKPLVEACALATTLVHEAIARATPIGVGKSPTEPRPTRLPRPPRRPSRR